MKSLKRISPALVLFLLAPTIGELLSGSAPPAEFFNPMGFTLLAVLYGGGAILIRELTLRWNKGWPTILTLGAAYGIIEEGLIVKSFFDPNWMDLGLLGSYGRWAGVNWVWSLYLTIYHATISIAIPILLVNLIYQQEQHQPWIRRKTFRWLSALFVLNGIFLFAFITEYRPAAFPYMFTCAIVVGLFFLARRLPDSLSPTGTKKTHRLIKFMLLGLFSVATLFIINGALPHSPIPPIITMLINVALVILIIQLLRRMIADQMENQNRNLWALTSGALGFFIALAPIQEFDQARMDNTSGMTMVGLAALIFLIWIGRRVQREISQDKSRIDSSTPKTITYVVNQPDGESPEKRCA